MLLQWQMKQTSDEYCVRRISNVVTSIQLVPLSAQAFGSHDNQLGRKILVEGLDLPQPIDWTIDILLDFFR